MSERQRLPETILLAAAGRPVTDIVAHPFISAEMTVVEATSHVEDGVPSVTIRLDMPRHFFCSTTGRTWPRAGAGVTSDEASDERELAGVA